MQDRVGVKKGDVIGEVLCLVLWTKNFCHGTGTW